MIQKYKYNVINAKGNREDWTGLFQSIEEAKAWYAKYGKKHEAMGHKLVLVRCSKNGR